jgi:hypothetical protein
MNVSMLMGALRRTPERSPAKILESLNRVLTGSESFTTCQAAWFGANGELVLANAGHLPPYLNSQEIQLPGGLPLGVLPDVTYEEVHLYLHPGDRLLLMSDGVVEARQPSGELFGFDRVHNLSGQSAFYIADAAKAFGQEDDITILTIRRLAQAMACPRAWWSSTTSTGATIVCRRRRWPIRSSTRCMSRASPSAIPNVPEKLRGTYAGLAHPASIDYLKKLGITAVELLPVHEMVDDGHLVDRGLKQLLGLQHAGILRAGGALLERATRGGR